MSVPITSADGYVLPHQSDNPSLILTNEGDSLSSINGPYTSPSPHIQNPLNALLHGCKQEFSVEQEEIYMVEDVQPLQLSVHAQMLLAKTDLSCSASSFGIKYDLSHRRNTRLTEGILEVHHPSGKRKDVYRTHPCTHDTACHSRIGN